MRLRFIKDSEGELGVDWKRVYVAQEKKWWGWKKLRTFETHEEAMEFISAFGGIFRTVEWKS